MRNLVKKTKKNVVSMNGTTVEFSPYEFIKKYNDWKSDMAGVSAGSIYSTKNLLETVRGHVNTATRRGRSKNSGSKGAFKVLDELDDLISEKQQLFFADTLTYLRKFEELLEAFLKSPTLNPQNVKFTKPKGWKTNKKGTRIIITDETPVDYYGHFVDSGDEKTSYFRARNKINDADEKKSSISLSGWDDSWSSNEKNTAKPPLYMALYEGYSKSDGLLEIIKEAIEELENKDYIVRVTKLRQANKLARIPEIRRVISGFLKRRALFDGGDFKTNNARTELKSKVIELSEQSAERLSVILYGEVLAGDLSKVQLDLTKPAMKRLIELAVVTRTSELKDRKSPSGEPIVLKSWKMIL
tara:strand:+ start:2103 stop:3170 length:1068 start_codon:yes stop_codon:yes gene_type:complete